MTCRMMLKLYHAVAATIAIKAKKKDTTTPAPQHQTATEKSEILAWSK